MRHSWSGLEEPGNSGVPDISSANVQPNDQMSTAVSYGSHEIITCERQPHAEHSKFETLPASVPAEAHHQRDANPQLL